ncbi:MAG: hypothetical protein SD837_01070 [Candidatus Electrothrix scaldis]|nr:MAG: hypothetical protein SD837_01070 [Candidatus Electrothrix sp. GW3-3]
MGKKIDLAKIANAYVRITPNIFGIGVDISALLSHLKNDHSAEIEEKAELAVNALKEATAFVSELEKSINVEIKKVTSLKEEYEKYQNLASISEEQSKALIKQLEYYQDQGKGKERLIALLINIVAGVLVFILGVFLSPFLTSLIKQMKN